MTNLARARQLVNQLTANGVREIVLCAGARNSPLVAVLSGVGNLRLYHFFEERSAGFFAVGRIKASGRPVAVCTTSGTAVAELLPAVIESDYQGLPLVVVSADRPQAYRGSGAPQTIVQPGLFSHYVERSWDLNREQELALRVARRPVHVNVCFDEPLIDGALDPWLAALNDAPVEQRESVPLGPAVMKRPLVIVGQLSTAETPWVREQIRRFRRPVYLEALSQLRGSPELTEWEITAGEEILSTLDCDGVIRIGGVPTLRYWRDLERSSLPVMHFSPLPWSGLPREMKVYDLETLKHWVTDFMPWSPLERERNHQRTLDLEALLLEFPRSEAAWVRRLSDCIPDQARVFLGNSLPIREWDLAARRAPRDRDFFGNRGTNGIDGLISTFIGLAHPERSNWAVLGDLSTLYDLAGPWALRQRPLADLNLVVINNGGGKIFTRLFNNPLFENAHDLNFAPLASLWKWNYQRWTDPAEMPARSGATLFEIVPDPRHTEAFCQAWEKCKC